MPSQFSLTGQLNIAGPFNLKPTVGKIQRELDNIKVNVDVGVNPKSIAAVKELGLNINKLNTELSQTVGAASTAETALLNLNRAFARFNTNVRRDVRETVVSVENLGNVGSVVSADFSNNLNKAIASTTASTRRLRNNVNDAATEFEAFGRLAALSLRRFAAFSIATGSVFSLIFAVQNGIREFINFDRELTRLTQVTGKTKEGLRDLSNEITRLSVTFGVSSSELTQVAVTLAQAGLSARDTKVALEALAKSARLPSFDNMLKTTEAAIAIFQQFKLEAKDLEGAIGSINAVSAAFAVEAQDITVAIQKAGGVFAAAANVQNSQQGKRALNEFIALFTSIRQTTRETADTIATGLRTITARLQRPKTIEFLREFGIELQDTEGKFVGLFEASKRLSSALNQIDPRDIRFAEISEEIGGIRQLGKTIPLIKQVAVAQNAFNIAQEGSVNVNEQVTKGLDSLAVRFSRVREEFLALIRSIGESQTFKILADGLIGVATAAINVVDAIKPALPFLTILAGISAFGKLREFGRGAFTFRATQGPDLPDAGSAVPAGTRGPGGAGGAKGFIAGLFRNKTQQPPDIKQTVNVRDVQKVVLPTVQERRAEVGTQRQQNIIDQPNVVNLQGAVQPTNIDALRTKLKQETEKDIRKVAKTYEKVGEEFAQAITPKSVPRVPQPKVAVLADSREQRNRQSQQIGAVVSQRSTAVESQQTTLPEPKVTIPKQEPPKVNVNVPEVKPQVNVIPPEVVVQPPPLPKQEKLPPPLPPTVIVQSQNITESRQKTPPPLPASPPPLPNINIPQPQVTIPQPETISPNVQIPTPTIQQQVVTPQLPDVTQLPVTIPPPEVRQQPVVVPPPSVEQQPVVIPPPSVKQVPINVPTPEVKPVVIPKIEPPQTQKVSVSPPSVNVTTPKLDIPTPQISQPDVVVPQPQVNITQPPQQITTPKPDVNVNVPQSQVNIPPQVPPKLDVSAFPRDERGRFLPRKHLTNVSSTPVPQVNVPEPNVNVSQPKVDVNTPDVVVPKPPPQPTPIVQPQVEQPSVVIPKTEPPNINVPRQEIPNVVVPQAQTPQVTVPQQLPPDVVIPKQAAPKIVIPKQPTPNIVVQPAPVPQVTIPEPPDLVVPKPESPDTRPSIRSVSKLQSLGESRAGPTIQPPQIVQSVPQPQLVRDDRPSIRGVSELKQIETEGLTTAKKKLRIKSKKNVQKIADTYQKVADKAVAAIVSDTRPSIRKKAALPPLSEPRVGPTIPEPLDLPDELLKTQKPIVTNVVLPDPKKLLLPESNLELPRQPIIQDTKLELPKDVKIIVPKDALVFPKQTEKPVIFERDPPATQIQSTLFGPSGKKDVRPSIRAESSTQTATLAKPPEKLQPTKPTPLPKPESPVVIAVPSEEPPTFIPPVLQPPDDRPSIRPPSNLPRIAPRIEPDRTVQQPDLLSQQDRERLPVASLTGIPAVLPKNVEQPVVDVPQRILRHAQINVEDEQPRISTRAARRIFEQDRVINDQFDVDRRTITPTTQSDVRLDPPPLFMSQFGAQGGRLTEEIRKEVALQRQGGRENQPFTEDVVSRRQTINRNQLDLESVFGQRILQRGFGTERGQLDVNKTSGRIGSLNENIFNDAARGASPDFANNFKRASQALIPLAKTEASLTHAMNAYLKEISLGTSHIKALGVAEGVLARATENLVKQRILETAATVPPTLTERLKAAFSSATQSLNNFAARVRNVATTPISAPQAAGFVGNKVLGGLKNLGGVGVSLLGTLAGGTLTSAGQNATTGSGAGVLGGAGGALSGAGTGALLGSFLPGIGTAIGAAVGGVIGGLTGLSSSLKEFNDKKLLEQASKSAESFATALSDLNKKSASDLNLDIAQRVDFAKSLSEKVTSASDPNVGFLNKVDRFSGFRSLRETGSSIGDFFGDPTGSAGRVDQNPRFTRAQIFANANQISKEFQGDAQQIAVQVGAEAARGRNSKLLQSDAALQTVALGSTQGSIFLAQQQALLAEDKISQKEYNASLSELIPIGRELLKENIELGKKQFELANAYKATLPPLDLLVQRFKLVADTAKFVQGEIPLFQESNASRISGRIGNAQSTVIAPNKALNTVNNLEGADQGSIAQAVNVAGNLLGRSKVFTQLDKSINGLTRVQTTIPNILQEARTQVGLSDSKGNAEAFIIRQVRDTFGDNKELQKAIVAKVEQAFGDQDITELEAIDKLLQEDLGNLGGELSQAAKQALSAVLTTYKQSVDAYIDALNQSANLHAQATKTFAEAAQVRIDNRLEQQRLGGRSIGLGDIQSAIDERISILTGQSVNIPGIPGTGFINPVSAVTRADPLQLENRLNQLQTRKSLLEGAIGNTTDANEITVLGDALRNVNSAATLTRNALEELANSTQEASFIREKLNELERIRSGAQNIFEALITGNTGDLQKIIKEQLAFSLAQGGKGNFNQPGFGRDALAGLRRAQSLQTPDEAERTQRGFFRGFAEQQQLNIRDPRLRLAFEGNDTNRLTRPLLDQLSNANQLQANARDVLGRQELGASEITRDSGADQIRATLEQGLKQLAETVERTFRSQEGDADRQAAIGVSQAANKLAEVLQNNPIPETVEFRGELKPVQHNVVGGSQIAKTIVKEFEPLLENLINEKINRRINPINGSTRGLS